MALAASDLRAPKRRRRGTRCLRPRRPPPHRRLCPDRGGGRGLADAGGRPGRGSRSAGQAPAQPRRDLPGALEPASGRRVSRLSRHRDWDRLPEPPAWAGVVEGGARSRPDLGGGLRGFGQWRDHLCRGQGGRLLLAYRPSRRRLDSATLRAIYGQAITTGLALLQREGKAAPGAQP